MPQVETNFKDNKGTCGCALASCNIYGTLRKAWRDGTRCVKGCTCDHCRGYGSKRKGRIGQVKGARALGIQRSTMRPGHEELFGGAVRTEIKSGAIAKPVETAYRKVRAQSDASRAHGDVRAFTPVFWPDESKVGYVVIRTDEIINAVDGLYGQLIDQGA